MSRTRTRAIRSSRRTSRGSPVSTIPTAASFYDEEEEIYKCWYSIFIRSGPRGDFPGEGLPTEKRARVDWTEGRREFGVCYATSKDGICWEKPVLGLIDFNGSKKNNIVLEYNHGVAVMKDPHETDPQKRYKAIHPEREHGAVWFSADGIVWGNKHDVGPIDFGDTNQSVWWDEDLGKYVLITRRWGGAKTTGRYGRGGHRQKVRSESEDFLEWSKTELVIEGLDLDRQIHDMIVIPHAGVYLGLVGLFDIEASRQWCELAWSPDSKQWHRIQPGKPLIANGPVMGDYDWGCIFASKPIVMKDEILLYYGANDGRFMAWRNGYLALARLRPDGFAGYEQIAGGSNKTGSFTAKLGSNAPQLAALRLVLPFLIPRGLPRGVSLLKRYRSSATRSASAPTSRHPVSSTSHSWAKTTTEWLKESW